MKVEEIPYVSGHAVVPPFFLFPVGLLEKLSEGIVLLDGQGNVCHHNRAAVPWLAHCQSRAAELRHAISQITSGARTAPLSIASLFKSVVPRADYYLSQSGVQSYALFIVPTLPVAAHGPADCANCLYPRQAEMYAHDLALLLPQRHAGSTVSSEELDFLAQLTSERPSLDTYPPS